MVSSEVSTGGMMHYVLLVSCVLSLSLMATCLVSDIPWLSIVVIDVAGFAEGGGGVQSYRCIVATLSFRGGVDLVLG